METTMKDKMSCRGASHDFLTEEEIRRIGGYVPEALRAVPVLVTAETEGKPVGFMGLDGEKLGMLFLEPDSRGAGRRRGALPARRGAVRSPADDGE